MTVPDLSHLNDSEVLEEFLEDDTLNDAADLQSQATDLQPAATGLDLDYATIDLILGAVVELKMYVVTFIFIYLIFKIVRWET